jgi:hypothetical protein
MKSILVIMAVSLSVSSAFAANDETTANLLPQAPVCTLDNLFLASDALMAAPAPIRSQAEQVVYGMRMAAALNSIGDYVAGAIDNGGNPEFSRTMAEINSDPGTLVDAAKCSQPDWHYSILFMKMKNGPSHAFRVNLKTIPAVYLLQ